MFSKVALKGKKYVQVFQSQTSGEHMCKTLTTMIVLRRKVISYEVAEYMSLALGFVSVVKALTP